MTGSHYMDNVVKDAADFLVLIGPLVTLEENRSWAVPIVREVAGQPPDIDHIVLAHVDDMEWPDAEAGRNRLIESYKESFKTVNTAETQEAFAEAIAIQFPCEETRIALSRFRAITKGAGSA